MGKNYQAYLVVSDIDGTLITEQCRVPEKNLKRIEEYTSRGGLFTIATGRSILSARRYARLVQVKHPVVAFNGAALYDYCKDELIWSISLPTEASEIVRYVLEKRPDVEVEVFAGNVVYLLRYGWRVVEHVSTQGLIVKTASFEELPEKWFKAMFCLGEQEMAAFEKEIRRQFDMTGLTLTLSDKTHMELLCDGVTKATGVARLSEMMGIPQENTIAIGDFYNDREMLQWAGISAAVEGAPPAVASLAKLHMGRCEDGAVGELLSYIEENLL